MSEEIHLMKAKLQIRKASYRFSLQVLIRLCYVFLILSLSLELSAQPQASDHHYPSTRNAFHNSTMQAYIFHEVGDYITQSYDYIYVLNNFYNTNYLFHEPISWSKKVNRRVDMSAFQEDYKLQLDQLLRNYQISLYWDTGYAYPYMPTEVDSLRDSIGISTSELVIRESWYFHPEIKGFKSAIIAIGLVAENGKTIAWYPYPTLRIFFLQLSEKFGKHAQMDAFFQSKMYPTNSLSCSQTVCGDQYAQDGFGNEFDAMFEVAEFANRVRYLETLPKKDRKATNNLKMSYLLNNESMLSGNCSWSSFTKPGATCTQNFESGLANGSFEMKEETKLLLKTTFKNALYDGKYESYHSNGNKRSEYYFKEGLADSVQRVWYADASLRYSYEMKMGEMHGNYVSYHSDSTIYEKGQFENGYVIGNWSYHIPLIHYFCYYMNETSFEWTIKDYIREDAFKDCYMDLEMDVEKKIVKGCPGGFCLLISLNGDIR